MDEQKLPLDAKALAERRKARGCALAIVAAIGMYGLLVSGLNGEGDKKSPGGQRQEMTAEDYQDFFSVEVKYEVVGTADSVSVTIETPTGTSQAANRAVPLCNGSTGGTAECGITYTFDSGDFVYLSAQNDGKYGTVTCRISVDGRVISENEAVGAYAIASCDGTA